MKRMPGIASTMVTAVLLVAGCATHSAGGSGGLSAADPSVPAAPSASPTSPATATGTATATGAPTTTAPTTTAPVMHAYPSDYAHAILAAWANHDTAYLTLLTSASTSHQIADFGNINHHWTLIRSEGAAGGTMASFYNAAGDEIILRVDNAGYSAHHWHVGSVQNWNPITFPSNATAYTREYVQGWIDGNAGRMNILGTTALTTHYRGMTTPTPSFTLLAPFDTGSGEVEVEIKDASTSLDTSVIITTATLGHVHAIGGCDLGC